MSPKYKIIYFDARGVAEPIRFLLAYLGEPFEEQRIQVQDRSEWLTLKSTTPFGKLPILEIDGKRYTQSVPLYRYLGKLAKLAGDNDLEELHIDIIADVLYDLRIAVSGAFWEPNAEIKKTKLDTIINDTMPFNLSKLEEIAKNNNGYLANKKLSWVDFMFASTAENFIGYLNKKDCLASYPMLLALQEKVLSLPKIKAWVEKRPNSFL